MFIINYNFNKVSNVSSVYGTYNKAISSLYKNR